MEGRRHRAERRAARELIERRRTPPQKIRTAHRLSPVGGAYSGARWFPVSPRRRLRRSPIHTRTSCTTNRSCTSCRTSRPSAHPSYRNHFGTGRPPWTTSTPRSRSGRGRPHPPDMPSPPRELSSRCLPIRRCFRSRHRHLHRMIHLRSYSHTSYRTIHCCHHHRCRPRSSRLDAGGDLCRVRRRREMPLPKRAPKR